MVVSEGRERHQTLDEEVGQFDEETELRNADDESIEVFTDTRLHELHFFPLHQLAFGIVSAALGVARLFSDFVEFLERDRPADRLKNLLMRLAVTALRPRGR